MADSQSIRQLRAQEVNGQILVEFVYEMEENGDARASNEVLVVKLGAGGGLEWGRLAGSRRA